MKKHHNGFTLIELLVVIAIIGILSAVVLASLSTSRQKAQDAKVEEQMNSFRNAAAEYFTINGNFGIDNTRDICNVDNTDTTGLFLLEQASSYPDKTTTPTCTTDADPPTSASPATMWSAYYELSDMSFWCVDSTGASRPEPVGWSGTTEGAACN